jgi:hypothetical protein
MNFAGLRGKKPAVPKKVDVAPRRSKSRTAASG